ncbi:MAG: xanthine dehydrogenase family protein subunit M, partial [Proteobacteria bacterium]
PLLSQAILSGASPQLRNMATTGGNILQRTRCAYFYDTATPCNKREPGSGCSAKDGWSRMHAILGASDQCIAVHPSDMCVALAALEAVVQVNGVQGARSIAFQDFHRLPGSTPERDNVLARSEIITSVDLPKEGYADHSHYLKIRDRSSYAFALVSVAVVLEIKDGTIEFARIALGGVAHKPWRDLSVESLMKGASLATVDFEEVADLMMLNAKGYGLNDFKIPLGKRAIVRALEQAVAKELLQ